MTTSNHQILATVLQTVQASLKNFASQDAFLDKMRLAYEDNFDIEVAWELARAWQKNDFSIIPRIQFLTSAELNGANGAYSAETDTIYLSQEFFTQNQGDLNILSNLLLEEIGHRIDTHLNISDSAGDEGAIFAAVVTNKTIGKQEFQLLKSENDLGEIRLNEQLVSVEMQNIPNINIDRSAISPTIAKIQSRVSIDRGVITDGHTATQDLFKTFLNNPKITNQQIVAVAGLTIDDFPQEKALHPDYKSYPEHQRMVDLLSIWTGIDPNLISDRLPNLGFTGKEDFNISTENQQLRRGTGLHDITDQLGYILEELVKKGKIPPVPSLNESIWGYSSSVWSALKMALPIIFGSGITDISFASSLENIAKHSSILSSNIASLYADQDLGSQLAAKSAASVFNGIINDLANNNSSSTYASIINLPNNISSNTINLISNIWGGTIEKALNINDKFISQLVSSYASSTISEITNKVIVETLSGVAPESAARIGVDIFGIKDIDTFNVYKNAEITTLLKTNLTSSAVNAIQSFVASTTFQKLVDWNIIGEEIHPKGMAIGGMIGSFAIPIPVVGTVIGQIIGNTIGSLVNKWWGDKDYPRAASMIGYDPVQKTFVVTGEYVLDGGNLALAQAMGPVARDFLNYIIGTIGGEVVSVHSHGFGHYFGGFVYQPASLDGASGGSSPRGRVSFSTPEKAIEEGIIDTLKSLRVKDGNPYMMQVVGLLNSPTYKPTLNDLIQDLGIAKEYASYRENPYLYGALVLNIPDAKVRTDMIYQWLSTKTRAEDILKLNEVANSRNINFNTADFTKVSNFKLTNTSLVPDGIRLTQDNKFNSGSVFYKDPIKFDNSTSFNTSFEARISGSQGTNGGDGLAFVMHNDSSLATDMILMGQAPPRQSLVIEFDTYGNAEHGDINNNHVGLNLTSYDNTVNRWRSTVAATAPFDLNDGSNFFVWIDYDSKTDLLQVFLSKSNTKPQAATLTTTIDIASILGEKAYVGLSAITGGIKNIHDILGWQFTASKPATGAQGNNAIDPLTFNESFYRLVHPDVDAEIKAGKIRSALDHYLIWGYKEKRVTNFDFSEQFYRLVHPDVDAAIKAGTIPSAIFHYINWGYAEKRANNFHFDEGFYRVVHGDVDNDIKAGKLNSGLQHYVNYGYAEGRVTSLNFDEQFYRSNNGDVDRDVKAGILKSGLYHYINWGYREGRVAQFNAINSNASIEGTANADILRGANGNNYITGGGGNDSIHGDFGDDTLFGGTGNDLINGNQGDDLIYGDEGDDTIDGNEGNDSLYGGFGNDIIHGGMGDEGKDLIHGNQGDDLIYGDEGKDTLYGDEGNDILHGGVDNSFDIIDGGEGIDTAVYGAAKSNYVVVFNNNGKVSVSAYIPGIGDTDDLFNIEQIQFSDGLFTLSQLKNLGAIFVGDASNNLIIGGLGNDELRGLDGNDILNGGGGIDTLIGGNGNDVYVIDTTTDTITETTTGGIDTVQSSVTYSLGANLENLILTGTAAINGTGNTLNNTLTGNAANNTLNGGDGNDILNGLGGIDTLIGGNGNDVYVIDTTTDTITETTTGGIDTVQSTVTYSLGTNLENLTLTGTAAINGTGNTLNNRITGNTANNILNGGDGIDTLIGGDGNDTYVVDTTTDTITETTTGGTDTVQSSVTYSLGANLENLILTGTAAINGTGNTLNNRITGNAANNTLNGGDGNDILNGLGGIDTLIGGNGNDVYVIDTTTDTITETTTGGIDTVQSAVTYSLGTNLENLILIGTATINGTGNTLNNRITGNTANNILNGGNGIDTLIGGNGNDVYVVDTTTDTITETTTGGIDTVQSSVTYSLGTNLENLILTGTAAINGTGNSLNNTLTGNAANNTLNGGDGNDILNGGGGIDTLIGGNGNDTYIVDTTTDTITETTTGDTDTVQSSVTYSLGANVENLILIGTATINGTGNTLNNTITGNAANNTLNGGLGNDTYIFNTNLAQGNDTITEATNAGEDTIVFTGTGAVTLDLSLTTAQNVNNNLVLTVIQLENVTGGRGNDNLFGNDRGNILRGGAGNDRLNGGGGSDSFVFGGAGLSSAAALGVDTIFDFVVADDKIQLSKSTFTALTTAANNPLGATEFVTVTTDAAALAATAAIVYNSTNGKLFYNADGVTAGLGTNGGNFAQLSAGLSLTNNNFTAIV